jgi:hypothetical protein
MIYGQDTINAEQASGKPTTASNPSLTETERWINNTFRDNSGESGCSEFDVITRNEHHGPDFDCTYQKYSWEFDGCTAKLFTFNSHRKQTRDQTTGQLEIDNGDDKKDDSLMEFQLRDIDPKSIRAEEPRRQTFRDIEWQEVDVCMTTTNSEDKVLLWYVDAPSFKDGHQPYKVHDACGFLNHFVTVKPEYAPRFVNALKHAVELCGGKPSAF